MLRLRLAPLAIAHLFAALFLVDAGIARAQAGEHKPVVGVRTFDNPPDYYSSTIGTGMTDLLTSALMKTGKYRIVERAGIDELIDEIELGKSGYSDKSTAVPMGHFAGLEYLIMGKVTNFGEKQTGIALPVGIFGYRKDEAYVRVDFRLVDAVTREIIYSGFGEGLDKTSGVAVALAPGGAGGVLDVTSRPFLESRLGRATIKAIDELVDKIDTAALYNRTSGLKRLADSEREAHRQAERDLAARPGKVLAAGADDSIVVSIGASQGLNVGDQLEVSRQIEIRDSRGTTVFSDEKPVAILTVTQLQQDRARATRLSGEAVEEGFIVRKHQHP